MEAFPEARSYVRRLAMKHRYVCPLLGGDLAAILRQGQLALAQALRKRALRICPARVVDRSWAVVLDLTRVQLPASRRVVFLARTSGGWTAWYHS